MGGSRHFYSSISWVGQWSYLAGQSLLAILCILWEAAEELRLILDKTARNTRLQPRRGHISQHALRPPLPEGHAHGAGLSQLASLCPCPEGDFVFRRRGLRGAALLACSQKAAGEDWRRDAPGVLCGAILPRLLNRAPGRLGVVTALSWGLRCCPRRGSCTSRTTASPLSRTGLFWRTAPAPQSG